MRKSCFIAVICVFSFQACEKGLIVEDTEYNNGFVENEIHCIVTAGLPSDQKAPETRVVLDGDSPSAPIVAQWQGSTSSFQDRFAIIGEDNDGGIAHVTDALRLVDETEDSVSGTFEFSFDKDYWIDDLDCRRFYALYPVRDYDSSYLSGNDYDNDNWLYRFSEQSGLFSDLTHNLFMVSPQIDLDNPSIEFQYGIAILRLSSLHIPDLVGRTVSNIKVKSNAIRDAIVFNSNCSFSDYYAAGNEICITGDYLISADGKISDNLYLVFFPSKDPIEYLYISVEIDGNMYYYSYSGNLSSFTAGKVYTLSGATLLFKDTSPDFAWYLNPVGENRYEISNAKEFLGFQKIVNGEEEALAVIGLEEADKFESKTVDIVAGSTIDLSEVSIPGVSWSPIVGFKGTLNGHNSSITGLYISGAYHYFGACLGLFETIESARIESLNVEGVFSINGCFNGSIGGLVANANQSSIINCSASISLSHSGGYGNRIGGIVGSLLGSSIIGSSDTSIIDIETQSLDSDYVGGVVGFSSSYSTICACSHFESPISVNARSYVGGVIGRENGDTRITACYNSGRITLGGQGGQIHGGGNVSAYPYVSSCYYTRSSSSVYTGANAYYGIGRYPGDSYDYGTQRVTDEASMNAACEDMNSKIDEWNSSNPTMQCSRRYHVENGQIVFN